MTDPASNKKSATLQQIKRIALWAILFCFLVLTTFGCWFGLYVSRPGPKADTEMVKVTVPRGTSVRGIGKILDERGLIENDLRFLLLARFSGYSSRLQAGEFLLKTGQKPGEVLKALASARSIQYSITVPEGLRAEEIAAIFADGGWCNPARFTKLVTDKKFLKELGFVSLSSLEGYLYPDTYLLTKDMKGADKIIPIMVKRFNEVWQELAASQPEVVDRNKTVILASIVEKETGAPEERPLIAGVFHNRLKKGMRLQSDPTVVYGSKRFSQPITRKDLKTPTPYNTYTLPGLPFGPICNPGREALAAVLQPEATKNIYFVSKNNGTHHFSKTLAEHNRAVQKYQRKKSKKKGK